MSDNERRAWPKAILFDLDDTLWPLAPVLQRAEQITHDWLALHAPRVAQQFSIDALRQQRMALAARQPEFLLDLAGLRRTCLHSAFAQAGEDSALVEQAMDLYLVARNAVTPFEDVLPALAQLKQRALLGSISNGNADLHAIGLSHHFTVSLAAQQAGCVKPAPAIFHAACRELGVAPADALYVGDDVLLDVRGAQQAGLRAVWLNRTGSSKHLEHQVEPDAICADLGELLSWLARHHA